MNSNGGSPVFILYKVINSDADAQDPCFNAFPFYGGRPTLSSVKQNCAALYGMNNLGPEGYHWRVCVEDKHSTSESGAKTYSWWDIQDENAALPVKEASQYHLNKFFNPPKDSADSIDVAAKAAKGAFKSLGKAMSHAVGAESGDYGPPVRVVAFKLLDLVKMHDDFATKHHGRGGGHIPQPTPTQPKQGAPSRPTPSSSVRASAPARQQQQQQQQPRPQAPPRPQQPAARPRQQQPQPAQEASLMDFGPPSSAPSSNGSKILHHASSMPLSFENSNETRAEKLKREYAQKQQTAQRVWDEVDQRWVDKDHHKNISGKSHTTENKKKETGISLDPANAAGKSANVQAAVNKRVNEMRESQAKALQEVREREEKKKREEAEEDLVRKKLEPKIKVWSEEHGKKKQLRALLASLHTILWPEANWKQVTIGDLLDDKKVKLAFHKASRVVHPDKTHHLDAEKRFLAKRIFDAISQAKTEFDEGK